MIFCFLIIFSFDILLSKWSYLINFNCRNFCFLFIITSVSVVLNKCILIFWLNYSLIESTMNSIPSWPLLPPILPVEIQIRNIFIHQQGHTWRGTVLQGIEKSTFLFLRSGAPSISRFFRTHVRTCVRAYMRTCVHAYARTCVHAYARPRPHRWGQISPFLLHLETWFFLHV